MTNISVTALSKDLLAKILMHALSNSITDFVNGQLCCKAFHSASNDNKIFKNISMEKFNFVPWCPRERIFQKRCVAAKNAKALYRKGMVNLFSRRKLESGLRCLKKATEEGHVEAIYAYGIILICLGGDLRKQGLQIVSSLNLVNSSKRGSRTIANFLSKIERFFSNMWVNFALTEPKQVDYSCDPGIRKNSMYSSSSEGKCWETSNDLSHYYDSSFWDREATFFCRVLKKYLVA
ncbi:hypothetical protein HRI_000166000 [Hibiscus trionum]|uniref:At2g35280-like TPR domain-containing protein n=1 Tax=Hibiscus trionum TaxID=183268 RepID=A0A9W7LHY4_HIBTR|nr:hypothetical protein HRI_000166000 [Hibiscus trionum]